MKIERTSGFVLFSKFGDEIKYLFLFKKNPGNFWDIPKGHLDGSEDDIDAAIRELREETGIEDFEIIPGFKEKIIYNINDGSELIEKHLAIFLARSEISDVKLSEEHTKYKWMSIDELLKSIQYYKEVFKKADRFLNGWRPSRSGIYGKIVAVVGASRDKKKYGFEIFKFLLNEGVEAYPVNPNSDEILHVKCYPKISDISKKPDIADIVVPPKIAVEIVKESIELGVSTVWLQPGSESEEAIELCKKKGVHVIYNACITEKPS